MDECIREINKRREVGVYIYQNDLGEQDAGIGEGDLETLLQTITELQGLLSGIREDEKSVMATIIKTPLSPDMARLIIECAGSLASVGFDPVSEFRRLFHKLATSPIEPIDQTCQGCDDLSHGHHQP